MIHLKQNLRKELACAIVETWFLQDGGKKILDIFFSHGRCPHITAGILTQEAHENLDGCVDKTFITLLNLLYDPIAEAIDDWIDVYKISYYEDFLAREKESKARGLKYGS